MQARAIYFGAVALAACVIVMGAFWSSDDATSNSRAPHMSVAEAHARALAGEIVLIDVRRPNEWRRTGLPASGHAVTMHQNGAAFRAGLLKATDGRPDRPVALICATGGRSTWVQPQLRQWGFQNLINVAEGMVGGRYGPGWLKSGLPVRRWASGGSSAPQLASGQ